MNDMLIQVICRTLAHSLWQGIVLALLAGLVILFTRNTSAARRYHFFSALLVTFLVAVNCTWYYEAVHYQKQETHMKGGGQSIPKARVDFTPEQAVSLSSSLNAPLLINLGGYIGSFLQKNAGFIVGSWFLIFCYKCLDAFKGLRHIYRIRNYQAYAPSDEWQERIQQLQHLLNIRLKVRLLESRLVSMPAVTGVLKPMILVPIGMLNNLPAEQVEAILLHELAHIRRADYFVNLLQRFVEILFFFNPGVIWLSSLIKDERENCCDDMAVDITQNKKGFVQALVAFQEYSFSQPAFSMGLSATKPKLLNRSKRLLYGENTALSIIEKLTLSACLLLLVVFTFAFQDGATPAEVSSHFPARDLSETEPVTGVLYADRNYDPNEIPEGTSVRFMDLVNGFSQPTYLFKSKDTLYQVSGDIRLFKINGQIIPQENYKAYLPKIRSLMAAYRQQEAELTSYLDKNKSTFTSTTTEKTTEQRKTRDTVTTTTTTTTTVTTTTSDEAALSLTTNATMAWAGPQASNDTITAAACGSPVTAANVELPISYSQLLFLGGKKIGGQHTWPAKSTAETTYCLNTGK